MKKIFIRLSSLAVVATPFTAFADTGTNGLFSFFNTVSALINQILPIIISLTLLVFLWGIFLFVMSGADMDKRAEARGYILWGIIALAVMVSVWGLVNLLRTSISLNNTPISAPGLPGFNSGT